MLYNETLEIRFTSRVDAVHPIKATNEFGAAGALQIKV